uniref:Ig-like domain-containing protein n=1 Tax=Sarcophilus harrisii TaxID=9305 RepID=A0A7N4PH55_SARHA
VRCLQKVEQSPQSLRVQEGDNIAINCSYTENTSNGLQWFIQDSRGRITSLFIVHLGMQEKGRLRVLINTKDKHSSFHIINSKTEDSGTYLCAATN